jgi:aspartate/methionine/tyrosine aminotransferase
MVRKAAQLNEFIVSHAPSMVQKAGECALREGEEHVTRTVEALRQRVAFCREALTPLRSVWVPEPEGAFYLFPRIEGVKDSFAFALELLRETRVSVAPGVAFGEGGEGSVRICCASDMSVLEPAMERLVRFVGSRG